MKKIKVGFLGGGIRAEYLAKDFLLLNCDVVAVCETRKERHEVFKKLLGEDVAVYENFDEFIEHGLDVVVLTNFFHEHAPYAIECFKRGIHVFSECISNGTMAEGVELILAYQNTKSIYFIAENYPQMIFNREMKKVCDSKVLGKILYAEGEYNHPGDPNDITFSKDYNYFEKHWRNHLPRTYYVTHSLGPIMHATGATPKKVTAFAAFAADEGDIPTASYNGDKAAVIMTQNDDGSIFRFTGCAAFGGHHNAYRIAGTKGTIENLRGMGNQVMLRYNHWEMPEGAKEVELYEPKWNDKDEELFKNSGHGGGDYLTARLFIDCIKEGKEPEHPYDIYSAVAMSSVAILGHRSVLEGGAYYDIPDFRNEEDCKKYENDRLSPFCGAMTESTLPACSHTDFKPTEKQVELYRKLVMKE